MGGTAGVLLLDKPTGPTSREVLDGLEQRLLVGPIGHAGTLDPLASGLLVALTGRARRLQDFFLGRTKTYVARVRFGETTPTLDAEGEITPTGVTVEPMDPAATRALLARFEGDVLQAPPAFSAIRLQGRRAHRLARQGREVALDPRPVRVERIELLSAEASDWVLEITCGPGVYIRSLARDLGEARGTGAWLAALRRTSSGSLRAGEAVSPATASIADIRPLAEVLAGEPRIDVTEPEARLLACGNVIARDPVAVLPQFAWFRGRPCFRLIAPAEGLLRSNLLIDEPGLPPA